MYTVRIDEQEYCGKPIMSKHYHEKVLSMD